MIKNLFFILLLLISNLLFAQEWTEPVNISNMDGTDYYPDITVSPDGTLHCVWVHFYNSYHREVFYSLSTNEGDNWSTPLSISNNDTLAVSSPHIVADSQNYLYVTYEYDSYSSPIVVMQKFDGISWSERDTVVNGYSHNNKIFIDNNDRIYVFYSQGVSKIQYKYLENDVWSESITPFDIDDFNIMLDAVIDQNNDLHIIGNYQYHKAYYKYNPVLDQWDSPVILSDNTYQYEGSDITLDSDDNPHLVWHEYASDIYSFEHATFYRTFNGTSWSTPRLIAEKAYRQKIAHFNNQIYIMDMEDESEDSSCAVLYQQDKFGSWYGTKTLNTSKWIALIDFGVINERFYNLFYGRFDDIQHDIYFRKSTYGVGINTIDNISNIFSLNQNYPNPFRENTNITYMLKKSGYCTLAIYNTEGKLVRTLVSEKKTQGTYNLEWNGTNPNGEKLPAGIYYYRLSLDDYRLTKSLIIN